VPVPRSVRSLHAVFTRDAVEPVADVAAPPAVLLRRFGASDDALAAVERRPYARVFAVDTAPELAAGELVAARQSALQLAVDHDGIVIDLAVPRVIRAGEVDPAVASHWIALDLDDTHLLSRGLQSFGLPELRIETGEPPPLDAVQPEAARTDPAPADPPRTGMVLAVAMGLAQRLITEWPANDPVGPAAVTLHDIALGFADPEPAPREPALDLMIDYVDGLLDVTFVDDPATLFS